MLGCIVISLQSIPLFIRLGFVIYLAIPIGVKLFPAIIRTFAFLNFVCLPLSMLQLHDPKGKTWNLKGVTNYYLEKHKGVRLGIWHMAPTTGKSLQSLAEAEKVIFYCHGNAFHRAFMHRLSLYNLLRKIGFHVVCFDYRGFADSSGLTTEAGVIQDAVDVYRWTVAQLKRDDCQVLVWGHSLGTTVSTQMMVTIQEEKVKQPNGLVLEAPFTSFLELTHGYPMSRFFISIYPKWVMTNLLKFAAEKNDLSFNTVENLPKVKVDILILHAKDDTRVPYRYGKRLFKALNTKHSCRSCKFISFKYMHRLGHNNIYSFEKVPEIVQEFSSNVKEASCHGISEVLV